MTLAILQAENPEQQYGPGTNCVLIAFAITEIAHTGHGRVAKIEWRGSACAEIHIMQGRVNRQR
jgi:hypothetical protein